MLIEFLPSFDPLKTFMMVVLNILFVKFHHLCLLIPHTCFNSDFSSGFGSPCLVSSCISLSFDRMQFIVNFTFMGAGFCVLLKGVGLFLMAGS